MVGLLKNRGPGLDGIHSIYQGNPSIFPKGHLWAKVTSNPQELPADMVSIDFHLLKIIRYIYSPLLVSKGIDLTAGHIFSFFTRRLGQMEVYIDMRVVSFT